MSTGDNSDGDDDVICMFSHTHVGPLTCSRNGPKTYMVDDHVKCPNNGHVALVKAHFSKKDIRDDWTGTSITCQPPTWLKIESQTQSEANSVPLKEVCRCRASCLIRTRHCLIFHLSHFHNSFHLYFYPLAVTIHHLIHGQQDCLGRSAIQSALTRTLHHTVQAPKKSHRVERCRFFLRTDLSKLFDLHRKACCGGNLERDEK